MAEVVQKRINGNGVAEITLNRPEVYNVYNEVFLESLRAAYLNFGSNPDVRVILLRGNGKYFSAGADVEWFKKLSKSSRSIQLAAATLSTSTFEVIWQCPKPTIALIHRGCFGGGVGFAAISFFDAIFYEGFSLLSKWLDLKNKIKKENYDYIITGEGKIDEQTKDGKLLKHLSSIGLEFSIPILAFAGLVDNNLSDLKLPGITKAYQITPKGSDLSSAIQNAPINLDRTLYKELNILLK